MTATGCGAGRAAGTRAAPLPRDARLELLGSLESVIYPRGTNPAAGFGADGAVGVNAAWERGRGPGFYV